LKLGEGTQRRSAEAAKKGNKNPTKLGGDACGFLSPRRKRAQGKGEEKNYQTRKKKKVIFGILRGEKGVERSGKKRTRTNHYGDRFRKKGKDRTLLEELKARVKE